MRPFLFRIGIHNNTNRTSRKRPLHLFVSSELGDSGAIDTPGKRTTGHHERRVTTQEDA